MSTTTWYLHLINARPATFQGNQLVLASPDHPCRLVSDFTEAQVQQRKAVAYRKARNWPLERYAIQPVELDDATLFGRAAATAAPADTASNGGGELFRRNPTQPPGASRRRRSIVDEREGAAQ